MTTYTPKSKFISVNDLNLHYLDWDSKQKPAMVCVHGHTGQAHMWDEFAVAMSPYYHVYALDQRGHGDSEWAQKSSSQGEHQPQSHQYSRNQFVQDLKVFVNSLQLKNIVLVSLSMGGWVSLIYASENPNLISRLILVDIAPEPSPEALQFLKTSRPSPPLEFDTFNKAYQWSRLGEPRASDARLYHDVLNRVKQREDGKWIWKADPVLFNVPIMDHTDPKYISHYWKCLKAIECPILEIRGKESILVSDDVIKKMQDVNHRVDYADVDGAGHVVMMDNPKEFTAVIKTFLNVSTLGKR